MTKKKVTKKPLKKVQPAINSPKILIWDIETAPTMAYVWGLWQQNVGLNQIVQDGFIMAWAAKWYGEPENKVMYADQRKSKNLEDDKAILLKLWELLDQADIVVTQNGKSFDQKVVNTRFLLNGIAPPSSYRHIDTKEIAKKNFRFISNKLEYLSKQLNKKYKKLSHHDFSGFELWSECLKGNLKAWQEMEKYNRYDVLATEELYTVLRPYITEINVNVYHDGLNNVCQCGSTEFIKNGYHYTNTGKFQRYRCKHCGSELKGKENLLSIEKKGTMLRTHNTRR